MYEHYETAVSEYIISGSLSLSHSLSLSLSLTHTHTHTHIHAQNTIYCRHIYLQAHTHTQMYVLHKKTIQLRFYSCPRSLFLDDVSLVYISARPVKQMILL
ncbi:Hypothetical predicted protein [Octopus vulgaris]|uniref:Uncharacterized protein n=1 Tax=Octopus vulgaris TaxID=6645 RepID=A0AA36B497_OCTVU|nr:Hypothetical predicted protein [Octopus vulgaris]